VFEQVTRAVAALAAVFVVLIVIIKLANSSFSLHDQHYDFAFALSGAS
jgi:hypothetical protein